MKRKVVCHGCGARYKIVLEPEPTRRAVTFWVPCPDPDCRRLRAVPATLGRVLVAPASPVSRLHPTAA